MAESFLSETEEDWDTKGYEYFYGDDSPFVEKTPEGDDESGNDTTGNTVTGSMIGEKWVTSLTGDNFTAIAFGESDLQVIGMPCCYSPLADPGRRAYKNTFEADANVCFISFGIPKINRALFMKLRADNASDSKIFSVKGASLNIVNNMATGGDHRLISFVPKFKEFWKFASVTANFLYTMMDLPGLFDWDDFLSKYDNEGMGMPFYVVKTTQATESLSNTYTSSSVVEKANSDAAQARQNYAMYGTYGGMDDDKGGSGGAWLANIAQGVVEKAAEAVADMPIIGGIASTFMKTNRGSMNFYAEFWQDSTTETSYQLSFKFMTPYGNNFDIFKHIYFPFSLLYTAALPRQDGKYSYLEPFIVKVQYPGWFVIECGVIQSLSWVKGGDNQLWSASGLPLEMTVTMTIKDLYPIQMSSEKLGRLRFNRGLLSFLQNMAGMSTHHLNLLSKDFAKLTASKALDGGFNFTNISLRKLKTHTTDIRQNTNGTTSIFGLGSIF